MKELVITDASISTVTVDIQVIRIGSKQMTLAVFRQLPYKRIFTNFGHLLASPWGWINYGRGDSPHKPFIFSYEQVLYRYDVNTQATLRSGYDTRSAGYAVYGDGQRVVGGLPSEPAAIAALENLRATMSMLDAAPQLFIAV